MLTPSYGTGLEESLTGESSANCQQKGSSYQVTMFQEKVIKLAFKQWLGKDG
jgi:hypothetical protein